MKRLASKELIDKLRTILAHHGRERVELIPILQEVQQEFGYLPREAMLEIANFLEVPSSSVYGTATFYNEFRLTPIGRHPVRVCLGTACHMRGGKRVLEAFEREVGIRVGEITGDGEVSLDRVACVGCCVMAPVVVIGEDIHPRMTPFKVEEVLVELKQKDGSQQSPSPEGVSGSLST
ncbi:MAG: NADH-quinone oxidoreductase subunit NuoE [Chloroflexi bacterium]|nr:NADH-quinone oxidoreductase subunit NuoE [Chloroflexota bacterium]